MVSEKNWSADVNNTKVLLILGGSSDLGTAFVREMHTHYDHIILHYNTFSSALSKLTTILGDKISLIQADFTNREKSLQFVNDLLNLENIPTHILHLPSEKGGIKRFSKMSWEEFDKRLNIGLRSIVMILIKLLPLMVKRGEGRILIMLTIHTCQEPLKGCADYITEKYALLGLIKALAIEYRDKNILINGLSPGAIDTRFNRDLPEIVLQTYAGKSGKNLTVDDLIPKIYNCLFNISKKTTGNNFIIDGKGLKKYE